METIDKEVKEKFNSTKVMRKIRDEISLEIMDMSYVEEKNYIDKLLKEAESDGVNVYKSSH